MAGTQALDLQRTVAFAAHAHELTVITDPKDPLYDRSIHDLIADSFLLSIATHGVLQDLKAQDRNGTPIVVFGKQRWKAATVIDHLVGAHLYKGKIAPVVDAIDRHRNSDLGKRIIELVGAKGIRLTVRPLAPAGGAAKVRKVMGAENAHRRAVTPQENAFNAQRLDALGVSHEEIAEDLGVPLSSISRLLKLDPDAPPKARKARTTLVRPGAKKLEAARDAIGPGDGWLVLDWVLGLSPAKDLIKRFPQLEGKV
jgi:DNA-directed RNA polymerase specialized sigma24 family protein